MRAVVGGLQKAETLAPVRHRHWRVAQVSGVAARTRCDPSGDGIHWGVLEADLEHSGRRVRTVSGERSTRQECTWSKDGPEGLRMDRRVATTRAAARQFRAGTVVPAVTRLEPLPGQS